MWKNSEMTSPFAATSMGAAYWVRRTALCYVCLFIALFTTVVVVGGGGGRVYMILNILLIFLEIVRLLCVLVS